MNQLVNSMRQQMAALIAQQGQPRWGTVMSVDPSRPAVKVLFQPEGVLSGWLPISAAGAAGGWGLMVVPTPGMMAFILPDLGDAQHGVVVGFAHNDQQRPPSVPNAPGSGGARSTAGAAAVAGELMAVHQSGAFLRMCADGSILLSAPTVKIDGNLTVNGTTTSYGDVTSTAGNVRAYLDVTDANQAHGTMGFLRSQYNAHRHTQGADTHGDAEQAVDLNDHQVP